MRVGGLLSFGVDCVFNYCVRDDGSWEINGNPYLKLDFHKIWFLSSDSNTKKVHQIWCRSIKCWLSPTRVGF